LEIVIRIDGRHQLTRKFGCHRLFVQPQLHYQSCEYDHESSDGGESGCDRCNGRRPGSRIWEQGNDTTSVEFPRRQPKMNQSFVFGSSVCTYIGRCACAIGGVRCSCCNNNVWLQSPGSLMVSSQKTRNGIDLFRGNPSLRRRRRNTWTARLSPSIQI
jgi:hypothetical protein